MRAGREEFHLRATVAAQFTSIGVAFGGMLLRLQQSRLAIDFAKADLVVLARIDKLTGVDKPEHEEQ